MSGSANSLRERLLAKLRVRGIDEDAIADSLAHIVKGEKISEHFIYEKNGAETLVSKTVTSTPRDRAQGAMLYDALSGGHLGLAPRYVHTFQPVQEMYAKYIPKVDQSIIARGPGAGAQPVGGAPVSIVVQPEVIDDNPVADAMSLIVQPPGRTDDELY